MDHRFNSVDAEKKTPIINAALEVFARNDFKRATMIEIAKRAQVSKSLLFYYFASKKDLYLYLIDYTKEYIEANVIDANYHEITDFYELLIYSGEKKIGLLADHPYITEFTVRAYYENAEDNNALTPDSSNTWEHYFSGIDRSKFRPGIDPPIVLSMLTWMTDGYLHNIQMHRRPIDMNDIMDNYRRWIEILRTATYRQEYL